MSFVFQIGFISHKYEPHILIAISLRLFIPRQNIVEGLFVGNVVYQKGANRISIVRPRDGPIILLSGRVPNLRPNRHFLYFYCFCTELYANSRLLVLLKFVLYELVQNAALSDPGISYQNELKQIVIIRHYYFLII